jgi:hypothetical protein
MENENNDIKQDIGEGDLTDISLFCCTEDAEANLIAIINSSMDVELGSIFTELGKDPTKFNEACRVIQLTYRITTATGLAFYTINLTKLLSIITNEEENIEWKLALIEASYNKLPTVIDAVTRGRVDITSIDSPVETQGKVEYNPGINPEASETLINNHWGYVKGLIETVSGGSESFNLKAMEFQYKSAFAHGWKHAIDHLTN